MTTFLPDPQFPQRPVSIAQSPAPRGPGTSFPSVPAGPQFRWKRGRQEGTDRWTWTGCGEASSAGRRREAGAPRSWLRILAKLPRQLWGRCSCLNPVPQERHLLVVGTTEMAAGFWTWLRGASFRGRREGSRQTVSGAGRVVCSAASVFPFFRSQPHPPGQEPAKSQVQPIPLGKERSQGIGGKEG